MPRCQCFCCHRTQPYLSKGFAQGAHSVTTAIYFWRRTIPIQDVGSWRRRLGVPYSREGILNHTSNSRETQKGQHIQKQRESSGEHQTISEGPGIVNDMPEGTPSRLSKRSSYVPEEAREDLRKTPQGTTQKIIRDPSSRNTEEVDNKLFWASV